MRMRALVSFLYGSLFGSSRSIFNFIFDHPHALYLVHLRTRDRFSFYLFVCLFVLTIPRYVFSSKALCKNRKMKQNYHLYYCISFSPSPFWIFICEFSLSHGVRIKLNDYNRKIFSSVIIQEITFSVSLWSNDSKKLPHQTHAILIRLFRPKVDQHVDRKQYQKNTDKKREKPKNNCYHKKSHEYCA